jgi:putative tryptophan/tyrosine transport system substrate-binding protein
LVGLQPDVILTDGTTATAALQRETQTIPIVFVTAVGPVASGIVPRLDRTSQASPTSNPRQEGQWLELLSKIGPGLKPTATGDARQF